MPRETAALTGGPLAIVGAGRVGSSLAIDVARAGRFDPVTLVCRSDPAPAPSSRLTALDIAVVGADPETGLPDLAAVGAADYVVAFCVPDDRLEETVSSWTAGCEAGRIGAPSWALHTSGLHSAEALAPLRGVGAAVAACHPLVAIARPGAGRFRGVTFGIDGDPEAVALAVELAAAVGGTPRRIRPEARPLYHLAAVFGSNFLVACLSVAARLFAESAATPSDAGDALGALLPLARSALDNLERDGLPDGMTGPIVRGDVETVRRHLLALDPVRRDLYRALGAELLAAREDRLGVDVVARLRGALGPGGWEDRDSEGGASDDG